MKIDLNLPPPPREKPQLPKDPPGDMTLGLGAAIKQIRTLRGVSQTALAHALSIGQPAMVSIEAGKGKLTVLQLSDAADYLEMELHITLTPKPAEAEPAP
jgi:transcriptional regulator with XRE-family HTH domain